MYAGRFSIKYLQKFAVPIEARKYFNMNNNMEKWELFCKLPKIEKTIACSFNYILLRLFKKPFKVNPCPFSIH